MNAKFISPGKTVDYTASASVTAGTVVVQGELVGIAETDIEEGMTGALGVEGVYEVVKDSSNITAGAIVYWDNSAKKATGTEGSNKRLGLAVSAAGTGVGVVQVKLG